MVFHKFEMVTILAGALEGQWPTAEFHVVYTTAMTSWVIAGVHFELGLGLKHDQVEIGVRYVDSVPEFTAKDTRVRNLSDADQMSLYDPGHSIPVEDVVVGPHVEGGGDAHLTPDPGSEFYVYKGLTDFIIPTMVFCVTLPRLRTR
jgi:hypothetical protein